jgi:hypothetical protein
MSDAASHDNYPNPRLSTDMEGPKGHASLRKSSDDANSADNLNLVLSEDGGPSCVTLGGLTREGMGLIGKENGLPSGGLKDNNGYMP